MLRHLASLSRLLPHGTSHRVECVGLSRGTCFISESSRRLGGSASGVWQKSSTQQASAPVSTTLVATRHSSKHRPRNKIYNVLETMPKKVDVKELQGIRLARRQKVRKYPPSTVYLQVLGSGSPGGSRALYVFTEQARYLFNCGEGTQRLAHEHKVKLSMTEHILITHKDWENVGGLPGILLTLQDTGVPEIILHGPPGIDSLYYDTRHFMRFRDLNIEYRHYAENNGIIGEGTDPLIIQCVPLWDNMEESINSGNSGELDADKGTSEEVEDLFSYEKPWMKKRPNQSNDHYMNPTVKRQRQEESTKCRNMAVAYICRPPPKAGALKLEKCVKAGVPAGPLLGELKRGQDVTLPNGNVVRAADVTEPDDPGPVFIVMEAPTIGYLDALLESSAFTQYQSSAKCEGDLAEVVVHFTPAEVMAHPQYQEWMARFSPSTSHIVINNESSCMGSEAVHRIQYKLNNLSERLFPLLKDAGIPFKDISTVEESITSTNGSSTECVKVSEKVSVQQKDTNCKRDSSSQFLIGPVHQATTLLTYNIRPKKTLNTSNGLVLCPDAYLKECYEQENFETILLNCKAKLQAPLLEEQNSCDISENYPNIIFLGTGSCIPNKTRNTSGILVNISATKSLLMDCGEGTYGQIVRLFGFEESDNVLRKLVAVYVSHLHADHHIGFIRLLNARKKAFHRAGLHDVPKLFLLAPSKIMAYLASYHANFEPIMQNFTLIGNQRLLSDDLNLDQEIYNNLCSHLDMKAISMTFVIHCQNSFGVALTHKNGWKLVYSGDTMPCQGLVDIGKNCDLLIHEATMEDELEEDARIKTHCTTSQAIQVGRDMNARYIVLTHFSQRYSKVPLLKDLPAQVGIAFDNMKICFRDLPTLHHMHEALVAMFAEDYDDMLEKTAKKRAARERLTESLKTRKVIPL
nr:ribonuclease Z, mitochondrial-like isoform X1 [Procambarus clarkii]